MSVANILINFNSFGSEMWRRWILQWYNTSQNITTSMYRTQFKNSSVFNSFPLMASKYSTLKSFLPSLLSHSYKNHSLLLHQKKNDWLRPHADPMISHYQQCLLGKKNLKTSEKLGRIFTVNICERILKIMKSSPSLPFI